MSALVIGHMNPDTDSIISAIAAADLYSKRGLDAVSYTHLTLPTIA